MHAAILPDDWFDAEAYEPYRENVPLLVGASADRDVEITRDGDNLFVCTPVSTSGTAALLVLGVPWVVLGLAGLIVVASGWAADQRLPTLLCSLFSGGVGIAVLTALLLERARRHTFLFDRSSGTLTARSRRQSLVVPLTVIESVELVVGTTLRVAGRVQLTYQLNLVFSGMRPRRPGSTERQPHCPRRKNLSACADAEYLKHWGQQLAEFLDVPFVDVADPAEYERAIMRAQADFLPRRSKQRR